MFRFPPFTSLLAYLLSTFVFPFCLSFFFPHLSFSVSRTTQTSPGNNPASYTMSFGSFPEVKRPGLNVSHLIPSSAQVKEKVELYFSSPSGPLWPVQWRNVHLPYFYLFTSVPLSFHLTIVASLFTVPLTPFLSVLRALQPSEQHQVIRYRNIVTTLSRLGFRLPFIASGGDVKYKRVHLHRSALLNEAAGGHKSDQFGFSLVSTFVSSATTF